MIKVWSCGWCGEGGPPFSHDPQDQTSDEGRGNKVHRSCGFRRAVHLYLAK